MNLLHAEKIVEKFYENGREQMDQVEQGLSGLTELIDRYGKEIRDISEEALDGGREPTAEETVAAAKKEGKLALHLGLRRSR